MEPKIYFTYREVHLMGQDVAVCWNTKDVKQVSTSGHTKTVTTMTVRDGEPYIDFVWIRQDERTKEYYEDEDNIGRGGFDVKSAKRLALELLEAVKYMDEQKGK